METGKLIEQIKARIATIEAGLERVQHHFNIDVAEKATAQLVPQIHRLDCILSVYENVDGLAENVFDDSTKILKGIQADLGGSIHLVD